MSFLIDKEIRKLIECENPAISGVCTQKDITRESQIQPCSIDLRIDEIWIPVDDDSSSLKTNKRKVDVGESVRVTTKEIFNLPADVGGLLLAPARVTRKGILVPDTGHIDPGFKGQLRLSLINLGKDPCEFKTGDVIGTVLLFRLNESVEVPFAAIPESTAHYSDGLGDVKHLSPDFLNIKKTARSLAIKAVKEGLGESGWKYAFFQWCLPLIIGVLSGWAVYALKVENRLTYTEAQLEMIKDYADLKVRLNQIEEQINLQSKSKIQAVLTENNVAPLVVESKDAEAK